MGVTIEICFKSLLAKIADALQLASVTYTQNLSLEYSSYVTINNGIEVATFQGTQQHSISDSEQKAALNAIKHLIKKYNVSINDINQDKVTSYKSNWKLYWEDVMQRDPHYLQVCYVTNQKII